jgi:AcrR family transcriptional regulator
MGRTRQKQSKDRHQEILEAAARVITDRGLAETRISDIAERCGVSPGLILYYFESKDRLLEQAVEYADRGFYERLADGQDRAGSPGERLVDLIEQTSLGPGGLNDYTLWMEIWVRARRDESVRSTYIELDRRQRALIAEIVREGQATEEFDAAADPDDFAVVLSGLLDGLGVQVTLGQPDVTPERMLDRCLAVASRELGCELRRHNALSIDSGGRR